MGDSIDYTVEFQDVNRRKIYDKKEATTTNEEDGVEESNTENFHYEEVEPNVHIKAINLVSEGLDFLEVTENTLPQSMQKETFSMPQSSSPQKEQFKLTLDDDDNDNVKSKYDDDDDDQ